MRPSRIGHVDSIPSEQSVHDRFAVVPSLVVSTHPIPHSSVFAHLPICPCGPPWPSSKSVCVSRGSGSKRVLLRVCSRKTGGRVSTNVFVRADGLTLWRVAQLAIDNVCVPTPPRRVTPNAHHQRSSVGERSPRKERTYPEFAGERGRARLLVLACGGWKSLVRRDCAVSARIGQVAPNLCRGSFRSVWKPHGFDVGVAFSAPRVFATSL